ncbi:MAG: hypothetical protein K2F81_00660 [Ruminococcus sp.]|nr:hypothetical protein [Ruminococcus sp.]
MYKCENCGAVFNDSVYKVVYGDEIAVCPKCEQEDFDEASQCEICGEWCTERELELCEDSIAKCHDCMTEGEKEECRTLKAASLNMLKLQQRLQ